MDIRQARADDADRARVCIPDRVSYNGSHTGFFSLNSLSSGYPRTVQLQKDTYHLGTKLQYVEQIDGL